MCTARAPEGHFGANCHPYVGRDKIFRKKTGREQAEVNLGRLRFSAAGSKKHFFIENLLENEAPERSAHLRVANNNYYLVI